MAQRSDLLRPLALAEGLLAVVIVGSVLAVGSLHLPTLLVMAALATGSAVLATSSRMRVPTVRLPLLILVALGALSLLQLVPLPFGWLARLAPTSAEVWAGATQPFGIGAPPRATISLDPGATAVELLKLWTYGAVLFSSASIAARRGCDAGALIILASATLLALVTIGHRLVDAHQVFGIYTPHDGGRGFRASPLINPNNLAGYLNMGGLCGVGLLAGKTPRLPRELIAVLLVPIVGLTVLTGSRAGLAALLVGAVVVIWLLRRVHVGGALVPRRFLALGAASTTLALVLALMTDGARIAHLLFAQDTNKLKAAVAAFPMVRDYPWLGVGRGAFESVFPAYHAAVDNTIYSHPENFLVQWATEWGVPATLLLLGAAAYAFRPSVWQTKESSTCAGLIAAAAALLAQNLFDLSLEVPGVAITFIACLGFGIGHENSERTRARGSRYGRLYTALAATAAFGLVGGVAWRTGRHTLAADRDSLLAVVEAEAAPVESWRRFRQAALPMMARHPAEPYFARLGAVHAWRTQQANPLPWIERALERGISVGRTHYLLGGYLAHLGRRPQALLELRLAMEYDERLVPAACALAAQLSDDLEELERAVPSGAVGALALTTLGRAKRESQPELAFALLRASVGRAPKTLAPRLALLRVMVDRLESKEQTGPCTGPQRTDCAKEARTLLEATMGRFPDNDELALLHARTALLEERYAPAIIVLAATCIRLEKRLPCMRTWAKAIAQQRDRAALSAAVRALDLDPCPDAEECADAATAFGDAALEVGDIDAALRQYERAAQEAPSSKRWRRVATAARKAGQHDRALRALLHVAAKGPGDRSVSGEIDALRLEQLKRGNLR
jgi:tetratricopeptide (TPR) repeat protein